MGELRSAGRVTTILCLLAIPVACQTIFRGRVVMADASAPSQRVIIEQVCPPDAPVRQATTNKQGEFLWRYTLERNFTRNRWDGGCFLRAQFAGFESSTIDLQNSRLFLDPQLPTLVLRSISKTAANAQISKLPPSATKSWEAAAQAVKSQQWSEAERSLRQVTTEAPKFELAWRNLGLLLQDRKRPDEARAAFQSAIALEPALIWPRLHLTRLEISLERWPESLKVAQELIQVDTFHACVEAYLLLAFAQYRMENLAAAETNVREALRRDPGHQFPQSEYMLGAILLARSDAPAAAVRLRAYLELAPKGSYAGLAREQLSKLEASGPAGTSGGAIPVPQGMLSETKDIAPMPSTEAGVPGGRKALAAVAGLKTTPSPENFFLEYCRAVSAETSPASAEHTPGYVDTLLAYLAAVADFAEMGERRGEQTVIALSLADPTATARTQRVLALLGWRVIQKDGAVALEIGDQPEDGPRQRIASAFGIDELALRKTLEGGGVFHLAIESEKASLIGGADWGAMLRGFTSLRGGFAEGVVRQPRLARVYAGLGSMGAEEASALLRRTGLALLTNLYGDAVWLYGDGFRITGGRAAVPGGREAESIWTKLAGTDPADAGRFFEALLKGDRGRLAAFYTALARADAAHQRYFTHDLARAQRYYTGHRDSEELKLGVGRADRDWAPAFFQALPLDESGAVRFPGGRAAWTSASPDEDPFSPAQLLGNARIVNSPKAVDPEALLAVTRLETVRGRPLDEESARLLAQNFDDWRSLFPYFEALPALSAVQFRALDLFAAAAASRKSPAQDALVGTWQSLAAFIVLGRKAGSLDDAAAARAFQRLCENLSGSDYAAGAVTLLRDLAGGTADLDETIASGLLQLIGPRRAGFERIRELQQAPHLSQLGAAPEPAKLAEALSGIVYGAMLDPDGLLVNEDHKLLAKHEWVSRGVGRRAALFPASSLAASNSGAGSHFKGGFANFAEAASNLHRVHGILPAPPENSSPPAATEPAGAVPDLLFHASARLVEVHTIVTEDRGRYVDDLTANDFRIYDRDARVSVAGFENRDAATACALLLDTTLSMEAALPALKNAALRLIGELRPHDSVAVYSLSGGFSVLQGFTTDKEAAARAVVRAGIGGQTALYDGLVGVSRELAERKGSKVIVVFTDGEDNNSTLTVAAAVVRARTAGIPIYTIAQGHALTNRDLLKELGGMSQATGGLAYSIRSAGEIGAVFDKVLQDLLHGYLLAFTPSGENRGWHPIRVLLRNPGNRKIRAREGYLPE